MTRTQTLASKVLSTVLYTICNKISSLASYSSTVSFSLQMLEKLKKQNVGIMIPKCSNMFLP